MMTASQKNKDKYASRNNQTNSLRYIDQFFNRSSKLSKFQQFVLLGIAAHHHPNGFKLIIKFFLVLGILAIAIILAITGKGIFFTPITTLISYFR